MLGYDFELVYKKGNQNGVADALSRKDKNVESLLYVISIIQPYWIAEAMDEWKKHEELCTFIQKLQQAPSASNTFRWKDKFIWYKDRLYLGKSSQIKQKVLFEFHSSLIGGNSGFVKKI